MAEHCSSRIADSRRVGKNTHKNTNMEVCTWWVVVWEWGNYLVVFGRKKEEKKIKIVKLNYEQEVV